MAELPFWQLTAATVSVVFVLIGAVGLIRLTRLATLVLVLSFLVVPALGLAVFAVSPGPMGDLGVVNLAFPFVGLAFVLLVANFVLRMNAGSSQPFASLHRRVPLFVLAWPCIVVAVSLFLWIFEPTFAAANLALNAAWFAIWLPRATRRSDRRSTYEIAAPRERVFAFVTDPSNWPLYNAGVEAVTVSPPGPLAVGSEITLRQRVTYPGLRGPRVLMPDSISVTSGVTQLVAGERPATRRLDLPDSADLVELTDLDGRTRITGTAHNVIAYRYAVLGAGISLALGRRRIMELTEQRQAKLKALLEQPPDVETV